LANQTFETAIALGIPKKAGTWRINSDGKTKSIVKDADRPCLVY
jgi:hypothetical protein